MPLTTGRTRLPRAARLDLLLPARDPGALALPLPLRAAWLALPLAAGALPVALAACGGRTGLSSPGPIDAGALDAAGDDASCGTCEVDATAPDATAREAAASDGPLIHPEGGPDGTSPGDAGLACDAAPTPFPCGGPGGYCLWPAEACVIYLGGGDPIHLDGGSFPGCRPLPASCPAAACGDPVAACACLQKAGAACYGAPGVCTPQDGGVLVTCTGI